jgi:hypothetical protein
MIKHCEPFADATERDFLIAKRTKLPVRKASAAARGGSSTDLSAVAAGLELKAHPAHAPPWCVGLASNATLDALMAEATDNLRFHKAKSSQTKLSIRVRGGRRRLKLRPDAIELVTEERCSQYPCETSASRLRRGSIVT